MNTVKEQYNAQYKSIKKAYRKRKMVQTAISAIVAIILLGYAVLNFKGIVPQDDFKMVMTGMFGIGAAIIAIRTPFHQTSAEQAEILSLNNAYTQERFKERNG